MTSLARRDNVGTGTGGRMATVGLLSSTTYEVASTATRPREHGYGIPGAPGDGRAGPRSVPSTAADGGGFPAAATSRPRRPDRAVSRRAASGRRAGLRAHRGRRPGWRPW